MHRVSTILMVLFFISITVVGDSWGRWVQRYFLRFNGIKYQQVVTSEKIRLLPSWHPEEEPCPLGLHEAITLARQYLSRRFPEVPTWSFERFSMDHFGDTHKWYYNITFTPPPKEFPPSKNRITVLVGLNGWIAEIEKCKPWVMPRQRKK